ncbi:MAG TPA: AraC family transcriptional regulator ligand-binding domain-containing protein [Polyangiaceae bacterium]|nr:AraC family transcriptional regulator ligand-binding domain-containing protein [Polyangiaceae bacterium]
MAEVPDLRLCAYSARLFQPFIRLLNRTQLVPDEWADAMRALDPDERLPASVAHQLLDGILSLGVDPNFGLIAGREWNSGDGGALDYAVTSAGTVRESIEAAGRYVRLVNDAAAVHLVVEGNVAEIRIENFLPMTRVGLDFQLGSFFRLFRCIWASGGRASVRVLIPYPKPETVSEHETTFEGVPLAFDSQNPGFAFDAALLDRKLTSADFRLHDTIRLHAEQMLQELPRSRSLTGWIESAIAAELPKGAPTVNRIAARLRMSTRTLERRLEREGTTFSDLLEELRRRLALRYVANDGIPLGEIAFLLGFSHTTGFHRAFKRWTATTPLGYRRAQIALAQAESGS